MRQRDTAAGRLRDCRAVCATASVRVCMRVFHQLEEIPADFGPTLVSVGNFDGVHRAHSRVLSQIVQRARERKFKSVAVAFEPHPGRILRPDAGLKLLTPTPQKLRLLESFGLDAVLLLPFTRDL